ncbi:MAG: division/cell wall cluster transcriptional repressor MraZ [Actinomycetota bacterium]|nr:division/cell wall cluster transcriptional repressor MraZ [Actinomycetota bacterium]
MAFRGTFDHSLDAKNRLTVPSKFRAALAEGVVLAKGIEPCVAIWTPEGFEAFKEAALGGAHRLDRHAQRLRRFFNANAFDTRLDAVYRVMIPPPLIEYAGLGKQVVVIGNEESLEVWDPGAWAKYETELAPNSDIDSLLGQNA